MEEFPPMGEVSGGECSRCEVSRGVVTGGVVTGGLVTRRKVRNRSWTVAVWVMPLLTGLGCGESGDDALVTSSDPGLASIAVRLLPDLAAGSGMELRSPVRVERRSRVDLERYLEFKIEEEFPEDRAEFLSAAYGLLGLVPPDMDLRSTIKGLYLEQVAGFYDPDSTTLFVLDDQPDEAIESLLVHELVHAIQDQNTDLDAITDPGLSNDRRVAAQAAIEGHATLVMFEFLMRQQGQAVDATEGPNFSANLGPALVAAQKESPALAGAPVILQESVLFPYRGGLAFVEALWRERGGRPPPFGSDLPGSTEEILHPEDFVRGQRDSLQRIELSVGDGWSRLYEDTLGELEVGILLEMVGGSRTSAFGWGGDRYVLLADGDGHHSLAWFSLWDTEEQRDRFVRELEPRLSAFPSQASLTAMEIGGLPATRLLVGDVPDVAASLGSF